MNLHLSHSSNEFSSHLIAWLLRAVHASKENLIRLIKLRRFSSCSIDCQLVGTQHHSLTTCWLFSVWRLTFCIPRRALMTNSHRRKGFSFKLFLVCLLALMKRTFDVCLDVCLHLSRTCIGDPLSAWVIRNSSVHLFAKICCFRDECDLEFVKSAISFPAPTSHESLKSCFCLPCWISILKHICCGQFMTHLKNQQKKLKKWQNPNRARVHLDFFRFLHF